MQRCIISFSCFVVLLVCRPAVGDDQSAPVYAGPTTKGFLLPNGWTLTPAGKHVPLTDLPLNIAPLADGRHARRLLAETQVRRQEQVHQFADGQEQQHGWRQEPRQVDVGPQHRDLHGQPPPARWAVVPRIGRPDAAVAVAGRPPAAGAVGAVPDRHPQITFDSDPIGIFRPFSITRSCWGERPSVVR